MIPLFQRYPALAEKLPFVSLGDYPSPIRMLSNLGREVGADRVYAKLDNEIGTVCGGSKVRKLEFLLGCALSRRARTVLTFGAAGSNHALATAIAAHRLGLDCICMLLPQPNAHYVRFNLLANHRYGAQLYHAPHLPALIVMALWQIVRQKLGGNPLPFIIYPGGSSVIGVVGLVNAAFELRDQIAAGIVPEPDAIYVALGTAGTAAGLTLGLKAAGLKSRVVAVRVVSGCFGNSNRLVRLASRTGSFLHSLDPTFPAVRISAADVEVRHEFSGRQYALFTRDGMQAVARMHDSEGIKLEGTYTGKTLAALIYDLDHRDLKGETVLFWNTYKDSSGLATDTDYHQLPRSVHRYFEEEVQPLDRAP